MKLIVHPYFNLNAPPTPEHMRQDSPDAASQARIAFTPYDAKRGDKLHKSQLTFEYESLTVRDALSHVFAAMNDDNRENGRTERSLSVGDVAVIVSYGAGGSVREINAYRVDPVDWTWIDVPAEFHKEVVWHGKPFYGDDGERRVRVQVNITGWVEVDLDDDESQPLTLYLNEPWENIVYLEDPCILTPEDDLPESHPLFERAEHLTKHAPGGPIEFHP